MNSNVKFNQKNPPEQTTTKENISFTTYVKSLFSNIDWPIFIIIVLLILIGLIMVFSATTYTDLSGQVDNPFDYLRTQGIAVLIGLIASIALIIFPIEWYSNYKVIVFAMGGLILLLLLTLILGYQGGGATSWLSFGGLNFQASEFVKIVTVLATSWLIVQYQRELVLSLELFKNWQRNVVWLLLAIILILIGLQPDYGMIIILLATVSLMLMITMFSRRINIAIFIIVAIGVFFLRQFSNYYATNHGASDIYQLNRIIAFSNPFIFREDIGYQLVNAYKAFSNGGWFGVGLGNSEMKHGYLPAAQTDFILAIIAEELGLIGVLVVLGLFGALILRLLQWSSKAQDSFRSKVLLGIALLLFVQVVVNVGGVIGLIPLTGVTLPFVSYGGTSMLMFIMSIGIAEKMIIEEKRHQKPKLNLVYSKLKGAE